MTTSTAPCMELDMTAHLDDETTLRKLDREVGTLTTRFESLMEKLDSLIDQKASKQDVELVKKDEEILATRMKTVEGQRNWAVGIAMALVLSAVLGLVIKTPSPPTVEIRPAALTHN